MKKKILLVDDEPDLKFLFKEGLEHAGLRVDAFNNSAEVLKDFKPHFYDLVILDIVMPDMDGFDLYKELKKLDPDVKVCFLTASQKYHEDFSGREHRLGAKNRDYRNTKKRIQRLHKLNLIERVHDLGGKHKRIYYKLSKYGVYYLIASPKVLAPGFLTGLLKNYGDHQLFQLL
ncbi:MAG TPA: response regulator, partial [Nitrososphaeraceae archaeon]|nr:response regulator [Nitrososphaeraceae archaeon]